jgi:hypothetical protein
MESYDSYKNMFLRFVDLEGQGNKSQAFDVSLIAPIMLVSKVMIFNILIQ